MILCRQIVSDRLQKQIDVDWFREKSCAARRNAVLTVLFGNVGGKGQNRCGHTEIPQRAGRCESVHDRHLHIHQQQIVRIRRCFLDSDCSVFRFVHAQSGLAQNQAGQLTICRRVVGDEDSGRLEPGAESGLDPPSCGRKFFCGLFAGQHGDIRKVTGAHAEVESTAHTWFAVHGDFAAQSFRQPLADGQSQPCPAEASRDGRIGLHELLEQSSGLVFRQPDPRVCDFEAQESLFAAFDHGGDDADATFRCEFDGVADKIHQNLTQARRIRFDCFRDFATHLNGQRQGMFFRFHAQHVDDISHQFVGTAFADLQVQLAGFDL